MHSFTLSDQVLFMHTLNTRSQTTVDHLISCYLSVIQCEISGGGPSSALQAGGKKPGEMMMIIMKPIILLVIVGITEKRKSLPSFRNEFTSPCGKKKLGILREKKSYFLPLGCIPLLLSLLVGV